MRRILTTVVGFLLLTCNLCAQVVLDEVVVTGTGTKRKLANSPVPVQVISANELHNAHVSSLEEALTKLSPNFTTMTNGMGTFISMNGMKDDYVVIMLNGQRLSGDDRFDRIGMGNIKRIEIVSGAASALYGSDAIGGVINIITDESVQQANVQSKTLINSKGRFCQVIQANVTARKLTSATDYQRREANNWQVSDVDEAGYKTGRPMSTGFRSDNFAEKLIWRPTDKWNLYVRGGVYDYTTRRPESATYFKKGTKKDAEGNYIYTETQAYKYNMLHNDWTLGAGAAYKANDKSELTADVYADNYTSSYGYFTKSGDFVAGDKQTTLKTHFYHARLKGIWQIGKYNNLSVGVETVEEQLRSQSDGIDFEQMFTAEAFAQDEWMINSHWDAVLGVRYVLNELYKSYATPSVALRYHVGGFSFRGSYSTGFHTPTLSQLYSTDESKTADRATVGNENLKPEKSRFAQFNVEYATSRFSASVTTYYNRINDLIDYRVMTEEEIAAREDASRLHQTYGTIRQPDNVDKARVMGVGISLHGYLGAGFSLNAGYNFTDTKSEKRETDDSGKEQWTESPTDKSVKHSANVSAQWNRQWGNYQLNVNINGHMQSKRYSSTYGYAPGYGVWNINTRHSLVYDRFTLEPGIGVDNVFNKRDTRPWNSNYALVNPGRSVCVSLTLKFN